MEESVATGFMLGVSAKLATLLVIILISDYVICWLNNRKVMPLWFVRIGGIVTILLGLSLFGTLVCGMSGI